MIEIEIEIEIEIDREKFLAVGAPAQIYIRSMAESANEPCSLGWNLSSRHVQN
jgi:hypothetical protein